MSQILPQVFKPAPSPHLSRRLLDYQNVSEILQRLLMRNLGRIAQIHPPLALDGKMRPQFLVKVGVCLGAPQEVMDDSVEPVSHGRRLSTTITDDVGRLLPISPWHNVSDSKQPEVSS